MTATSVASRCLPRLFIALIVIVLSSQFSAKSFAQPASWEDVISSTEHQAGYFDFYYKPATGQLLLKVERWNEDFLYANALSTGIGSNDIGLDRGQVPTRKPTATTGPWEPCITATTSTTTAVRPPATARVQVREQLQVRRQRRRWRRKKVQRNGRTRRMRKDRDVA